MNYGSDIPKVQRCNAPYAIEFGDGFDYERREQGIHAVPKIFVLPFTPFWYGHGWQQ
jgi:hypothetical protein